MAKRVVGVAHSKEKNTQKQKKTEKSALAITTNNNRI